MCNLQITKDYFLSHDHIKIHFHILNTFTKKGTRQNILDFMRDNIIASKTALRLKYGIVPLKPS